MEISKNMTNTEIAELLRAGATAYKIKDPEKNKFKIAAYERASAAIEHLSSEAKDIWDEGKLTEIGGVGESISDHLDEIFRTGKSKHFESLFKGIPPATFELTKVSGIGPKTAFKLSQELSLTKAKGAIEELSKAVKKGKVMGIEGMGEKSSEELEKSIREVKTRKKRLLISYADKAGEEIIDWVKKSPVVKKAEILGSLRRRASTVGDIDIVMATNEPAKAIESFTKYPKASRILEKGEKKASIILPGSIQVDALTVAPASFGAALQHFTGSKEHNIELREFANKKGLSLSEYGIRSIKTKKLKKIESEEEFYKSLGLSYIPPEIREAVGEIEAAQKGKIPKLVDLEDIKADLQIHSDFDIETSHDLGESSMEEIIKKAGEIGYEYLAFTEHNPSQRGHSEEQVYSLIKAKKEKIDKINDSLKSAKNKGIKKVFNSLEIDILPSGEIPVSDRALSLLDFALVSIHSSFKQERKEATKRVLSALSKPNVKIFAHPTGRKLNFREGVELSWEKIFEFCLKEDKWLEINADPMRLDLPDFLVQEAVKKNVKLTLGTDSHHFDSLDNMIWGVSVARRGWATKSDIVNSRSVAEFEKMLK